MELRTPNTEEELNYLRVTGLDKILANLASQLFVHRPTEPLTFMVNYLKEYKSSTEKPFAEQPVSAEMEKDDFFEERALPDNDDDYFLSLRNAPKRRMAICCEPVDTADLEQAPFQPTTQKSPETQERLDRALKNNVLFSHLEEEERKEVFGAMVEVKFMAGDIIIRQGKFYARSFHINFVQQQAMKETTFTLSSLENVRFGCLKMALSQRKWWRSANQEALVS